MKKYEKPFLVVEEIEIEDIIALSKVDSTTSGSTFSIDDFFSAGKTGGEK